MKTQETGRPVTVGEAVMALRKFAQKSWDYEELILNWAADWMEKVVSLLSLSVPIRTS